MRCDLKEWSQEHFRRGQWYIILILAIHIIEAATIGKHSAFPKGSSAQ